MSSRGAAGGLGRRPVGLPAGFALLALLLPPTGLAQGQDAQTPRQQQGQVLAGEAAASGQSSTADPLTPTQLAELEARIASFDAAMRANDMRAVLGVVPPAMLEEIAAEFNISVEQLMVTAQQQLDAVMADVQMESFSMDIAAARFAALDNGIPYALIPTETVIDMGEESGKLRSRTTTLGLLDEGVWYLVRTEDAQQLDMLKDVYPGFAGVKFKPGTMEIVTE